MGDTTDRKRRVGIIGNGHLGQFLRHELSKSDKFTVEKVWNRSEDERENVLPLTELTEENLKDIDLVIEVAHPQIVENFAAIILKHADFFVSSYEIWEIILLFPRLVHLLLSPTSNSTTQSKTC